MFYINTNRPEVEVNVIEAIFRKKPIKCDREGFTAVHVINHSLHIEKYQIIFEGEVYCEPKSLLDCLEVWRDFVDIVGAIKPLP